MESLKIHGFARDIVMYSEQMLDMAQQNRWNSFEVLQNKRQKLIHQLFQQSNKQQSLKKIANLLNQILEYDKQSILLGEHAKANVEKKLLKIRSNKHAVNTYQRLAQLNIIY